MSDADNLDALCHIVNHVENTMISNTNSISALSMEFLHTDRPGVGFKREQLTLDPFEERTTEHVKLMLGGPLESDLVGH